VSRGPGSGLANPHPLAQHLPAIYQQEDEFAKALTQGLDTVLAPVFAAIDNLDAYLDPHLSPEDFLQWLGGWLAVELDDSWPLPQRRDFVARATDLYRIRGTRCGLTAYLETVTGGSVEIRETGGSASSTRADAALPGSPSCEMVVRIEVDDTSPPALARLDALVNAAKPAHIKHRVEAFQRGSDGGS
jgi:phage tail-like protein